LGKKVPMVYATPTKKTTARNLAKIAVIFFFNLIVIISKCMARP